MLYLHNSCLPIYSMFPCQNKISRRITYTLHNIYSNREPMPVLIVELFLLLSIQISVFGVKACTTVFVWIPVVCHIQTRHLFPSA